MRVIVRYRLLKLVPQWTQYNSILPSTSTYLLLLTQTMSSSLWYLPGHTIDSKTFDLVNDPSSAHKNNIDSSKTFI